MQVLRKQNIIKLKSEIQKKGDKKLRSLTPSVKMCGNSSKILSRKSTKDTRSSKG